MSVASAVQPITPAPASTTVPTLPDLEDTLYDILASGTDPNLSDGTFEAVQTFVHEHARSRKSHSEFIAFFEARSLPFRAPAPSLFALPPLETRGPSVETPVLPTIPQAAEPSLLVTAANSGSRRPSWLWPALTLAAVSCGGAFGYVGLIQVQSQLTELRTEATRGESALARLEAENVELRARVRESAQQLQRIEHKTDLLLRAFASPINPNPR
jgi:hypothetical protein